jgi:hypothetical protein
MLALLVATTLFATTFASYGANLNYRSPSQHHPGLGINLRKVVKRSNPGSKWGKETTSAFLDVLYPVSHSVCIGQA